MLQGAELSSCDSLACNTENIYHMLLYSTSPPPLGYWRAFNVNHSVSWKELFFLFFIFLSSLGFLCVSFDVETFISSLFNEIADKFICSPFVFFPSCVLVYPLPFISCVWVAFPYSVFLKGSTPPPRCFGTLRTFPIFSHCHWNLNLPYWTILLAFWF